jgi:hypothetical protein
VRLRGGRGTLVVGVGDGPEAFLPGSVPDLQLDVLVIGGHRFESEVHPDGGHVVLVELVVCEPQQQAALAD